jgi:DNA polymerase-3 subunit delta'
MRLLAQDGLRTYAAILALFSQGYDRQAALKLADGLAGRANADKLDLMLELFDLMLTRLARHGLQGPAPEAAPGEAALFARLCPAHPHASRSWAELQQDLSQRARHGQAVNLDPAALILDITFKIHQRAAALAA